MEARKQGKRIGNRESSEVMGTPRTGTMLDKIVDTMSLLMWEPRTRANLEGLTGYDRGTVAAHVRTLHNAGLIRVCGYSETGAEVFTAQRFPFEIDDAPRSED